jgi:hypothetical protein
MIKASFAALGKVGSLLKRPPSHFVGPFHLPGSSLALRFRFAGEGWVFGSEENVVFPEPSPAAGSVSR